MDNFTYIPKLKRFLPATLSFLLLLISSAFSYFSLHTEYTLPLTLAAAFFVLISFQVFFRYCLTEHIYTVYKGIFTVTRKTGKQTVVIFELALFSECVILPKKEGKGRIKTEGGRVIYRTAVEHKSTTIARWVSRNTFLIRETHHPNNQWFAYTYILKLLHLGHLL